MTGTTPAMHVARISRGYRGKTYVTFLLRTSYRDGAKVKHRTLANLSHLPERLIDIIRRSLRGEAFAALGESFRTTHSVPHGHVQAVLGTIRALGLDSLLASKPCRERSLVVALIAARLLFPSSKLAATRHWHSTTLAAELDIADATEKEVYAALDWLRARQVAIEKKLAQRHLGEGDLVLYDVSSSFYRGQTCPLARYGHDRDGKKGLPIIVYGVLTTANGQPIAIDVYAGNTADPRTVVDQVTKLRDRFGLERIVLVGDRGMLTQTQIDTLKRHPGLGWISALKSCSIRALLQQGAWERSVFDEVNLAEITAPDFPDERLMACYNPLLAAKRRQRREDLLQMTEQKLAGLAREVIRRTEKPLTQQEIALKAGRLLQRWKMAKHFELTIADGAFRWARRTEAIVAEAALDGIYVIRTSEPSERLSAAETVRSYKRLAQVERVFRCFKGTDLLVRPIYHRVEPRVRAHFFLCLLAYYVEWQMRRAWAPMLFEDEAVEADRPQRDPVAPAQPSPSVQEKKKSKRNRAGEIVHSFRTLLAELAGRSRITYAIDAGETTATFTQISEPTKIQAEALRLLGAKVLGGT